MIDNSLSTVLANNLNSTEITIQQDNENHESI